MDISDAPGYYIKNKVKMNYRIFESADDVEKYIDKSRGINEADKADVEIPANQKDSKFEKYRIAMLHRDYYRKELEEKDIKKDKYECHFKNLIVFTNDKSDSNKTLKNIEDAKKHIDTDLHIFVVATDEVEYEDGVISDNDSKLDINKISNADTLVLTRLTVLENDNAVSVVNILDNHGFRIINNINAMEVACDKYETAKLAKALDLPQPNFFLATSDSIKDEDEFIEELQEIYPGYGKDEDKDKACEFVIKILDGHGGTGVFLSNGGQILSVLQAIFAISPDTPLLVQRKEEADGGDIRVHVLTTKRGQIILGAMKREKLKGDFRSNVSLGAKPAKVVLTDEQKKLAFDIAKASGLVWCAVDIMPLVHGSNKELGDNAILEINASPGTDGISSIIGANFMNILLDTVKPEDIIINSKQCGYEENATVTIDGTEFKDIQTKLDTGNGTAASTLAAEDIKEDEENKKVTFTFHGKEFTADIVGYSKAIVGDSVNRRPVIILDKIKINEREDFKPYFALATRTGKVTQILLNRDEMCNLGLIINPNNKYTKDIINRIDDIQA